KAPKCGTSLVRGKANALVDLCQGGKSREDLSVPRFDNICQPVVHPFTRCRRPRIRDVLRCFHAEITFHPNNCWRRKHSLKIGYTQRWHGSIRPVRPQRAIIFAGRLRGVTARVESDQGLLHIGRYSPRLRQQRGGALEIFQRCLSERRTPRFEIKLGETFAWIPEAFRRIFLHQAGRERHAFTGRFEERIELSQRDRALLAWPEIERMVFANTCMALALASLTSGSLVELLHAVIEGM